MDRQPQGGRGSYVRVRNRGELPQTLEEGAVYFVEDEGVIVFKSGETTSVHSAQNPLLSTLFSGFTGAWGPSGPSGSTGPSSPTGSFSSPSANQDGPPVGTVLHGLPQLLPNVGAWEGTIHTAHDVYRLNGDLSSNSPRHNRIVRVFQGGELVTEQSLGIRNTKTEVLRNISASFKRIR